MRGIDSWSFVLWRARVCRPEEGPLRRQRVSRREGFQAEGKVCVNAKACWVSHMARCRWHIYNEPSLSPSVPHLWLACSSRSNFFFTGSFLCLEYLTPSTWLAPSTLSGAGPGNKWHLISDACPDYPPEVDFLLSPATCHVACFSTNIAVLFGLT